ncbi:MAG: hypothetical protein LBE12_00095 [Planctomycetaceae bacterium]|nr:hypothetical protein [Planctomycetaceae bacterium]
MPYAIADCPYGANWYTIFGSKKNSADILPQIIVVIVVVLLHGNNPHAALLTLNSPLL